ncbi:hypothetical protein [Brucella anthropi]|uniref:hypothetical protein n=1 Tax=Brucella anthropi TaxID=529 RepID=UPI00124EEBC9|nr:hypothetical protein [Brucella anthropi]KAB2752341.1 hypothetical protein F9L05_04300 [Brucella anthropi]
MSQIEIAFEALRRANSRGIVGAGAASIIDALEDAERAIAEAKNALLPSGTGRPAAIDSVPTLDRLMSDAVKACKALTPEQQLELMEVQRKSFAENNVALSRPAPAATDTGLETVAWEKMDNMRDPNDKLVYEVKFPRNGDKRLVYKSQADKLLAERDIIIRSHLTTIATLNANNAAFEELCKLTFAIQHNPNCPDKFLIRLPGKSGCIDLKPYGDQLGFRAHKTGDVIGAGATLHEACQKALARLGQVGL